MDFSFREVHQQQYHLTIVVRRSAQVLPHPWADRLIYLSLWAMHQKKPIFSDGMTAAKSILRLVQITAGIVSAPVPFAAALQWLQIGNPICDDTLYPASSSLTSDAAIIAWCADIAHEYFLNFFNVPLTAFDQTESTNQRWKALMSECQAEGPRFPGPSV